MQLGPIQKEWVRQLKAHPEWQLSGKLGRSTSDGCKYCCLGLGLVVLAEKGLCQLNWEPNNDGFLLRESSFSSATLLVDFKKLGLRDHVGSLLLHDDTERHLSSLSAMNDHGITWIQIANFIEQNPELVFTKSV